MAIRSPTGVMVMSYRERRRQLEEVTSTLGVTFRFLIHPAAFGRSPHQSNFQQLILRRWGSKFFRWNHIVVGKTFHSVLLEG